MARLQSGEVRLALGWQSVEEVVGSAIRAARPLLGARQVLTRIPADLPLAEFDAVLIERVLANLLENAGKYAPDAGPIEVSAAAEQHGLRVTVADRGPGIAPEILDTIFEKFTRGGTESATPGVGLGLAICKAAVEAHGGRIWAENRPQGGAAFSFVLPLGAAPESQDRDAPEPGAPSGESPSGEAPAPEGIA
jgi:two-component system sensor histidine kinase KdpD